MLTRVLLWVPCLPINTKRTKPISIRRKIPRAVYDTVKAELSAKIRAKMAEHNLTPSEIQRRTAEEVMAQRFPKAILMCDLVNYRTCRSLPGPDKLTALAWVLKCQPNELVPKEFQGGRQLVIRRAKPTQGAENYARVLEHPDPGYAVLQVQAVLPVETSHKVAAAIAKQYTHYAYKRARPELSDTEVQEHLTNGLQGT